MYLDLLRVYHETVQRGSIRAAAEILNVAPSSVSRVVAELERRIGTRLLDRSVGGVIPTHAGRIVAEYARKVVLEYQSLCSDLNDARGMKGVLIRIAVVEGMVWESAMMPLAKLKRDYDGLVFRVDVLPPSEIGPALKRGDSDVGITLCHQADPELTVAASVPDPIRLITPVGHPLLGRGPVTMREVAQYSLGLIHETGGLRRLIDQAALDENVRLEPVLESSSVAALRSFVLLGGGVSLLNERTVEMDRRRGVIQICPVASEPLEFATIDVIKLRTRRLSKILFKLIDDICAGLKDVKLPFYADAVSAQSPLL
ncbi:transcriptional regulator LysR family [Nitrospirillum viridazoti Y2]|uniref:DNA-binding transcriptional LysR family regulator n=1 Tax=Nitrospirillum amazonense TaxID=28077 RepID=A0A560HVN4_9PROT|nr:LysR family transcriptional regulator [Nitrospirillum amazonense]EGX99482.1 transcriptional regulator LysR family [Nitrospirillum amazonense Y2]TWB50663.1 DNA-binding transcriptional LysR family regulator [Nitrospirillum amazonense]